MMMDQDLILHGKRKDLGGFTVVRSIPQVAKRFVGPFVFFDHMGPAAVDKYHLLDVRPHPHIGLSTVTYLFEGKNHHRDSLGTDQIIGPGDINWMTAGSGIVHSERTPCSEVETTEEKNFHGIQVWVALPKSDEDCAPSFSHYAKETLPEFTVGDLFQAKLLVGKYENYISPVKTYSPTLFMDLLAIIDGSGVLHFKDEEVGFYLASGSATVNGNLLNPTDLIIVKDPTQIKVEASKGAKVIIFGGSVFPEPRFIWWNFVSTDKEKISKAALAWENQTMGKVPMETDYIPLPKDPLPK